MDDSPARVTPEAAFRLSENYPALAARAGVDVRFDRSGDIVEFRL